MGRKIMAVAVGLFVAFAVMMIVEMINSIVIMPPTAAVMKDPAALREFMMNAPTKAYIIVAFGYLIASFVGGFVTTKLSRRESPGMTLPIIVGVILTLAGIGNFLMLPGQPMWFLIVGLLIFLPVTLIGHRFAR